MPVDDVYWANYTLLVKIMAYLFSPKINEDDVAILQLSDDHDSSSRVCHTLPFLLYYPKAPPSYSYAKAHMPVRQTVMSSYVGYVMIFHPICRFGPLIHHWTMRFEAKHKYFKQLANTIGNFINLSYTLSMRHQLFQCYNRLEASDTSLPEVGKGRLRMCKLKNLLLRNVYSCLRG